MKKLIGIIILTLMISLNYPLWAKPLAGFNKGPYLCIEAGIMQTDFDKDEQSGTKIGRDFEPAIGLIFGWNVWDYLSAELDGRYGTNINAGKREHLVGANINGKYFFILDALTDFPSLRIMPTIKGGFAFRVASLPGNINTTDKVVTTFGWGPSFGGGISFLWKKYCRLGLMSKEISSFLRTNDKI